jgi:hypothetical protein
MATIVRARIPAAIATLDKAIASLDAYTAVERKPEDDQPGSATETTKTPPEPAE